MFSEKQRALRCMIYKTHDHDSIPVVIPRDKLVEAHQFLCHNNESQDFHRFAKVLNGELEPSDEEVSRKHAVYEWYASPWYSGRDD